MMMIRTNSRCFKSSFCLADICFSSRYLPSPRITMGSDEPRLRETFISGQIDMWPSKQLVEYHHYFYDFYYIPTAPPITTTDLNSTATTKTIKITSTTTTYVLYSKLSALNMVGRYSGIPFPAGRRFHHRIKSTVFQLFDFSLDQFCMSVLCNNI